MQLKINEVAKRAGVTVRTLRYYDEIGLLSPSEITQAGYRLYDAAALSRLQQILFFRELSFPLAEIQAIMQSPGYDAKEALAKHRTLLIAQRDRLSKLITLVEQSMKGEQTMDFKAFDKTQLQESKERYAQEVRERWGDTEAYRESERRTAGYQGADWQSAQAGMDALFAEFAALRGEAPDSPAVHALVQRYQAYISERFYPCTDEILAGLGEMYVHDARFAENIDRSGAGTAAFLSAAIAAYCGK